MTIHRHADTLSTPPGERRFDLSWLTYPAWMRDALCAETDPEIFFPHKGGSTREAKAVCARCPVAADREQRLATLRHLAAGKNIDVVATIMHTPRDTIRDVALSHGYPDRDKLAWAADILANTPTPATSIPESAARPARQPVPSAPAASHAREAAVALTKPDELRVLLNTGKTHPSKRIQAAADRLLAAAGRLRDLLAEDQAKHAERRAREAEKVQARAEVDRLTRELAAARAKLKGDAQRPGGRAAAESGQLAAARAGMVSRADLDALGVTSADIRGWAHTNDVDCPTSGRLPRRVLDAWKTAHPDAIADDAREGADDE